MSEEEEGGVIILSVAITPEVAKSLDNFIGLKGDSREEVASHYVCTPHGVARQKCGELPEQASPVADEATDGGDGPPDDPADQPEE